ncbi:alpha-mannosidase [Sphingomonas sp. Leaf357]|uniref:GH92 family glycosyl hydrolase n=1 Tax=Sphingomonas sp. Leaf357 TaxID=1736350 RepID=UPI0006FD786E|nr:GH92 family glycosyl hydrolase [Sphingomonas sp. Leaf357]KQS04710.1 alpha-mannosidase [Sphingomonas sp. Leaf357]
MKISRRTLLAGTGALALTSRAVFAAPAAPAKPDLFIGTGGHGHTYPGATLPFGMVQLSPDTDVERWDACSGYHRTDTSIMGFSHTHLSGTGIGDMLDVLVVPTTGPVKLIPGTLADPDAGYRQRFSAEQAEPGYYAVTLESGVRSELTVTDRTGIQRHTFPAGAGHILVDLSHLILDSSDTKPLIDEASLAIDETGLLTGSRRVFRWAKGRRIHFAMQLSRKPDRVQFYGDADAPAPADANGVVGKRLKVVLHYDDAGAAPILIRTGISAVDVAGARANLSAEARHWNFDRYRADSARRWKPALETVKVEGGTPDQRTIMASALYHTQLGPTLFSDTDGRYVGLDRQVYRIEGKARAYSTYSLWDTYRALHPLLTLIQPERSAELTGDLIRQTQQSPYGPPAWPLQGVETGCMIGWHAVSVLAEARAKGIPADYAAAWPNVRRRAFDFAMPDKDHSLGREPYDRLGFIPADQVWESVSRTLEYSYDDYASASIADAAGATADAARLRRRSGNWRNVFDAKIGFARPRLANGDWALPYDPIALGHSKKWRDFTESNGWQGTFVNQHDVHGLIVAMGGDATFEAKLDALFDGPSTLPADAPPDISGLVGQYAHGNEPSHHVAYLYTYCGAAWKTQAMVRRLLTEMYKADPDGIIGNDDCGQMSAWFVLSALGIYPVDPVSANYVLGSPLFDRAEMRLGGGRRLIVEARGNAPDRPYVQSVTWNGRPWTKSWIAHADIARGGRLVFEMGVAPNRDFGRALVDRPPPPSRMP